MEISKVINKNTLFLNDLGIYGWDELEPVILASLITEKPLLLIGKHGTAKSELLLRIAKCLKLNFKHYNASLINYDDLVGIPIPTDDKKSLNYISLPTSIWDAEITFIDEINRTRHDLQNKLFPIIYEKRVQGVDLEKLRYRWAAMNPPISDDDAEYLGATSLDPALADRFQYIVSSPQFSELDYKDQLALLNENFNEENINIPLNKYIQEGKLEYEKQTKALKDSVSRFVCNISKLLMESFGYISGRRIAMFVDNIISVYSASIVINRYLNKEKPTLKEAIILGVSNSIPNKGTEYVDETKLLQILYNGYDLFNDKLTNVELKFALIEDPVEKLVYGVKNYKDLGIDKIIKLIPTTLNGLEMKYRYPLGMCLYQFLRTKNDVPAYLIETVISLIEPCFKLRKEVYGDSQNTSRFKSFYNQQTIEETIFNTLENNSEGMYGNTYLFDVLKGIPVTKPNKIREVRDIYKEYAKEFKLINE